MTKKIAAVLGVLLCAVCLYAGIRFKVTHELRCAFEAECPELVWLREQYSLDDEQFQKIQDLHNNHEMHCGHVCKELAETRKKLVEQGCNQTENTQSLQDALAEGRLLLANSQDLILDHMFAVSAEMDEPAAKMYRENIFSNLIVPGRPLPSTRNYQHFKVQLSPRLQTIAAD